MQNSEDNSLAKSSDHMDLASYLGESRELLSEDTDAMRQFWASLPELLRSVLGLGIHKVGCHAGSKMVDPDGTMRGVTKRTFCKKRELVKRYFVYFMKYRNNQELVARELRRVLASSPVTHRCLTALFERPLAQASELAEEVSVPYKSYTKLVSLGLKGLKSDANCDPQLREIVRLLECIKYGCIRKIPA